MRESHVGVPQHPKTRFLGLGSARFARRYWGHLLLDFFSWRYWDVSIPSVCLSHLLHSTRDLWVLPQRSFLIQTHPGQRSFGSLPDSFVAYTVFLRQHVPRHPSCALSRLSLLHDLLAPRSLAKALHFKFHSERFLTLRLFSNLERIPEP